MYINIFTEPVKVLIDFTEQFQNGYSGYERFLEILSVEPDIKESQMQLNLKTLRVRLHSTMYLLDIRTESRKYYQESALMLHQADMWHW